MDVQLTHQAQKDIKKLDKPVKERALKAIQQLQSNPGAGHTLEGSLKGCRSLEFSAPGGAYRAVYVIADDGQAAVLVFLVAPHENIYDAAKRRFATLNKLDLIWRTKP